MSKTSRRKPTHRVYAVMRRRTPVACWMDIGVATSHKDGKGFDLELQSMPLRAEELVVRTVAERVMRNGTLVAASNIRRVATRRTSSISQFSACA